MLLAVDVGNTTIVFGLTKDDTILKICRYPTSNKIKKIDLVTFLNKELAGYVLNDAIISSVVPSINDILNDVVKEVFKVNPIFINNQMDLGFNLLLDNPSELGCDLLTAAVGADCINPGNNLIVDLGTANKFIVVKGHDFLGGAIAPGLMISFNALFHDAELLEEIPLDVPSHVVGTSTVSCIQSGIVLGLAFQIEKMHQEMEKEVGNLNVILTGGNADIIKGALNIPFIYSPNLQIIGLMKIYQLLKHE